MLTHPLFDAHIALREIILGHRNKRVPWTPIQAFGLPLLADARSFQVPYESGESNPLSPGENQ